MYWLDNNTGISTAPTPPAVISLIKKYFTNGGAGEQPSIPEDFWFNMIQEELLGVLTMAGIAPAKGDLNQVAKAIRSIAFSAYPVGAPIPWPTAVPPSGFLALNGQSFSAASYPALAQAYPTLTLPDLRGYFIRGWDNGRGVDSGRSILSVQGDAIRNIEAELRAYGSTVTSAPFTTGSGAFLSGPINKAVINSPDGALNQRTDIMKFDASRVVPTAADNRPCNIAFYYIVRAA